MASCFTVKEDRSDCPCWLAVEMRNLPAYPATLSIAGTGTFQVQRDTVLTVAVPRNGVDLLAVTGTRLEEDGTVHIPYGFECPSLYLFSQRVETACDTARVQVSLHKHFCTLNLTFSGPAGWGEPYWAEVRGRVDGVDTDGTPLSGDFDCRLDTGNSVRLPRQEPEGELWLDVTMPDRVVRSFALGSYMLKAGYDWDAPDLEDLTLEMNLSVSELRFITGSWTSVISLPIEI